MKPQEPRRPRASLFVALAALVAMAIAGCQLFGDSSPLASARIEWVRADRATFDAIGEKFRAYVVADPAFVNDPTGAAIWLSAIDNWEARLESVERSVEPAGEVGDN